MVSIAAIVAEPSSGCSAAVRSHGRGWRAEGEMQASHSEPRMRLAGKEKTAEIGWQRRNRHQQPHFS